MELYKKQKNHNNDTRKIIKTKIEMKTACLFTNKIKFKILTKIIKVINDLK